MSARRGSTRRLLGTLALVALVALASSCAHRPRRHIAGVPIDQRPTPPQPAEQPPPEGPPPSSPTPAPPQEPAPSGGPRVSPVSPAPEDVERVKIESVMTPEERRQAMTRIVADTTAASAAARRCGSRKLLPDQESVLETAQSLLAQTRAALARDEVWRAESLARKSRQLASSLDCP
jgi:hypothetical protein